MEAVEHRGFRIQPKFEFQLCMSLTYPEQNLERLCISVSTSVTWYWSHLPQRAELSEKCCPSGRERALLTLVGTRDRRGSPGLRPVPGRACNPALESHFAKTAHIATGRLQLKVCLWSEELLAISQPCTFMWKE